MATYSPQGKAHKILERLALGDTNFVELSAHLGVQSRSGRRDKTWHICGALLHDRLIGGVRARYWITREGRDALEALRGGSVAAVANLTTFRVFS